MTDSKSDGQIEPKNSVFIKFPRVFAAAMFLRGKIWGKLDLFVSGQGPKSYKNHISYY